MSKFIIAFLSFYFFVSSAKAELDIKHFDWLETNLLTITSPDTDYIDSQEILAALANAMIANAKDDEIMQKKYLEQLQSNLSPSFSLKVTDANEYVKNLLTKIQNDFNLAVSNNNVAEVLNIITDIQTSSLLGYTNPYGYNDEDGLKISQFSFLKLAQDIKPFKTGTCYKLTKFYPNCQNNRTFDDKEAFNQFQIAVKYAKNPVKHIKDIRFSQETFNKQPIAQRQNLLTVPKGNWNFKQALEYMEYNPNKAYNTLKKAETINEKLQLVIFLRAYFPDKHKKIRELLKELVGTFENERKCKGKSYSLDYETKEEFNKEFASDLKDNDRNVSDKYLLEVAQTISNMGEVPIMIPCAIAKKFPEILEITKSRYYSSMDNFLPYINCDKDVDYNIYNQKIRDYIKVTQKADGNFLSNYLGTMKYGFENQQSYEINKSFLEKLTNTKSYDIKYPYEVWSYHSLENRKIFLEIKKHYQQTQEYIINYFISKRKYTPDEALIASESVLFSAPLGTRYYSGYEQYDKIPYNLRTLMIEQASIEQLNDFLQSQEYINKTYEQIPPAFDSRRMLPAPLIHIAVQNPKYLNLLFDITKDMSQEDQLKYDLVSDVNIGNNINKTPLMVAAQFDFIESAKILIEKGANVNAVTQNKEGCWDDCLKYDNRTALMYAAQNASLEFIKLLLEKGADKSKTDTKGYKAIDYLMGFAGKGYNQKLSDTEFEEAFKLLQESI